MKRAFQTLRHEALLFVVVLLVFPIITALLCPDLWLSPHGLDSWVYFGFFYNYPEYVSHLFPDTYYGSRLALILPGYAVHRLFSPLTAPFVLHIGVYYLAVLSLYGIAGRLYGSRAGFLAALLMGGLESIFFTVGWSHPDGVGLAYYLLCVYLLTRAAFLDASSVWAFGAGMAAAAMIHSNISYSLWLVPLPIYFGVLRAASSVAGVASALMTTAALAGSGAFVLTGAFGLVNWACGGGFLFWLPSLKFASSYNLHNNPWTVPIYAIFTKAYWMIPHWVALCLAVVVAMGNLRNRRHLQDCLKVSAPALNLLLTAVIILGPYNALMSIPYYASLMTGPSFLVLPALFQGAERLSRNSFHVLAASVAAILLLDVCLSPLLFPGYPWLPKVLAAWGVAWREMQMILGAVFGLCAVAVAAQRPKSPPAAVVAVTLMCLMFLVLPAGHKGTWRAVTVPAYEVWPLGRYGGTTLPLRPDTGRVVDAMERVRSHSNGKRIRFWWDKHDGHNPDYCAVASMFIFAPSLLNFKFPAVEPEYPSTTRIPEPGSVLVIMSDRAEVYNEAKRALANIGVELQFRGTERVEREGDGFYMTFADVLANAGGAGAQ